MATILLVDDDEPFAYATARLIKEAGHRVVTLTDSRKTLNILEAVRDIELLVVDVVMPAGQPHSSKCLMMAPAIARDASTAKREQAIDATSSGRLTGITLPSGPTSLVSGHPGGPTTTRTAMTSRRRLEARAAALDRTNRRTGQATAALATALDRKADLPDPARLLEHSAAGRIGCNHVDGIRYLIGRHARLGLNPECSDVAHTPCTKFRRVDGRSRPVRRRLLLL